MDNLLVRTTLDLTGTRTSSTRHRFYLFFTLGALLFAPCRAPVLAQANSTSAHSGPTSPAERAKPSPLTDKDTVVLSDFDNRSGETVFDDALKQALALELEQSPFLNLLSDRKVSEALRMLGHPADNHMTLDVGRELCLRTGSKAVLGGTLSNLRGHYLLELTAVACSTGDALANEQGEAASEGDVLKVLSQASMRLRSTLGEPLSSVKKFAVPIEVTTLSLDALKNYSIGITVRREKGDTPSIRYLKRATELDPNFPLASAELTAIYRNLQQPSLALEYAGKAYQLRDRVSEREKLKITGIYLLATGDLEKEIQNYEQWQATYPRDFVPYNNLGNDYAAMGQLDKSLAEYQQALQLMPSVIGYTNVVGMDLSLNRLDAAGAALDDAFANKLDGRYLHQNLYWLAFLRGNAAQMQQQVAWASGKPGDEDALLSMQSDTEAYHGRLAKAQDLTRRAVNSAVRAGSRETAALWQVDAALRKAEVGDIASAKQEATLALALSSGRDVKLIAAFTLARAGDSLRAKTLSEELLKSYPTDTLMKLYWLPAIDAAIELNQGNSSQAIKDLQAAAAYELGGAGTFINYLYPAYLRGQAYLLARNADAAAAEFQKLLDHSGVVSNFVTGALAHLLLGRADAMAGDTAKAKAAYQDFFALWKDADPEISILTQAKQEYTKLERRRP